MNRFIKLGKRMLALFIIVLLNINTYAAVSANDGSAFVTKAEFDALINTFNEQMDSYQSGLNAKIDGAIANYLAGLSSVSKTTGNIITSGWDSVSSVNGVVDPTFFYPSLNISYGNIIHGGTENSLENKKWTISMSLRYIYDATNGCVRALCTTKGQEDDVASNYGKIFWDGVTDDYKEKYAINGNLYVMNHGQPMYAIESDAYDKKMETRDGINVYISDGYISDIADVTYVINPQVYYNADNGHSTTLVNFANKLVNCEPTITYTNKIKYLDHIVQYDGNASWCLSNSNFTKTFRTHSNNTYDSNGLMPLTTKKGASGYTAYQIRKSDNVVLGRLSTVVDLAHISSTNKVYPSIGMLKTDVSASNIILTNQSYSVEYANKKETIADVSLQEGLPLLGAAKDTTIEWSPRFVKGKAKSSGAWVDSSATRAKLLLSIGPFTNKIDSSNIINGSSDIGTTPDGGILCKICVEDTDEATKVTFKMPTDGVVYAKWVPDTSDYDSASWYQPIDLTQSNTYIATTE